MLSNRISNLIEHSNSIYTEGEPVPFFEKMQLVNIFVLCTSILAQSFALMSTSTNSKIIFADSISFYHAENAEAMTDFKGEDPKLFAFSNKIAGAARANQQVSIL